MRRFVVLCLLIAACREDPPQAVRLPGSLRVSGNSGTLLDAPARAMACRLDTTTAVVAVGDAWAVAVSMRVARADGARELTAARTFAQPGSAVVALRSLGDSLHAWISSEGTVRVSIGDSISGSFDALVARDTFTMRVSGAFSSPEIIEGCP